MTSQSNEPDSRGTSPTMTVAVVAAAPETHLLIAIAGGLTVGLCAFVWMVADRVMERDPESAKATIIAGIGSWFIVDSIGSVAAGAPLNVLINAVFLVALLWPLRGLSAKAA